MKNFLLALMVVLTTCTLAIAQNQTTVVRDSVGKVKVTVTKDNKAKTNNTAVTVIGVDTADTDSTEVDANSSNVSTGHGKASFTFESDDDDFPFHGFGINGGILVAIISIIAVFGFPVFILFVIFFFRYKNRKARYRLAEQALAAGQPLPAEFIRENKTVDSRSQGIKNTFTGIGLFIFLWAI
ncbi:putative membrane protein, partial [Bacteroides fragilis str. 3397 T10]